jgi:hypothetical protein
MFVLAHASTPAVEEIKRFAQTGWNPKETPHIKIAKLYRLLEKERGLSASAPVVREFATLFGKSQPWAFNYVAFAKLLTPEIEEKIGIGGGLLRAPFPHILDMLRSEESEWFLSRVTEEKDFRELLGEFYKRLYSLKQGKTTLSSGPERVPRHRREFVPEFVEAPRAKSLPQPTPAPTSAPTPTAKPLPAISTLPEDEKLEAIRKQFSLGKAPVAPRKTDLPPIRQPAQWDEDRVVRHERKN